MIFFFLVFIACIFFFLALIPRSGPFRVRERTPREEALHDQIQQAMNWSPDRFYQREDGRWFNARGEEGVCMSLKEVMDKYCKTGDKE